MEWTLYISEWISFVDRVCGWHICIIIILPALKDGFESSNNSKFRQKNDENRTDYNRDKTNGWLVYIFTYKQTELDQNKVRGETSNQQMEISREKRVPL